MKSPLTRILAALVVVAARAGRATTGGQEGVADFLDRANEYSSTE